MFRFPNKRNRKNKKNEIVAENLHNTSNARPLQTRVDLRHVVVVGVVPPVTASLRDGGGHVHLLHLLGLLEEVDVHALRRVPGDVAVHRPDTRVVELDLHDEVAVRADELRVATLRVARVDDLAVPLAHALGQDVHVVAVRVHGVRGREADAVHDDADGFRVAHVEDLLVFGEVGGADGGVEEDGLVVVAHVGDVVHVPDELAGGVVQAGQDEVESDLGLGDVHLVGRHGDVKSLVGTCVREEETAGVNVRGGVGVDALVGLLVEDLGFDASGNTVVQAAASLALRSKTGGTFLKSHPDRLGGVITALDNDLSALTNAKGDHVRLVRLNSDEVVGDDGHVVAIDGEEQDGLGAVVDQTEKVLLASLELEGRKTSVGSALPLGLVAGVVGLAVDEHVVGVRREDGTLPGCMVDLLEEVLVVVVEPVRKHDGADIDVPLVGRRTVDDDGTGQAVEVLRRVVSVPPGSSEELSADAVGEGFARSDRALADGGDTVVPGGSSLEETVPVDGGTIILKTVVNGNLNVVTPVGFDERTGELVVHDQLEQVSIRSR